MKAVGEGFILVFPGSEIIGPSGIDNFERVWLAIGSRTDFGGDIHTNLIGNRNRDTEGSGSYALSKCVCICICYFYYCFVIGEIKYCERIDKTKGCRSSKQKQ